MGGGGEQGRPAGEARARDLPVRLDGDRGSRGVENVLLGKEDRRARRVGSGEILDQNPGDARAQQAVAGGRVEHPGPAVAGGLGGGAPLQAGLPPFTRTERTRATSNWPVRVAAPSGVCFIPSTSALVAVVMPDCGKAFTRGIWFRTLARRLTTKVLMAVMVAAGTQPVSVWSIRGSMRALV